MNVLAIGAHPDDITLSCGGTIKKLAKRGYNVTVCTVSNGCYGSTTIKPSKLKDVRPIEDKNAIQSLGAEYINLGAVDQFVSSISLEQVNKLVEIIRKVKPDLIITHSPNDYHRDHVETYHLVFRASCAASLHFWGNGNETPICPIYLMDCFALKNFEPIEYVDIANEIEEKSQATKLYESQYDWMKEHDNLDLCEYVKDCAKIRGYQCGVKYAEGFRPDENYGRMGVKRLLP